MMMNTDLKQYKTLVHMLECFNAIVISLKNMAYTGTERAQKKQLHNADHFIFRLDCLTLSTLTLFPITVYFLNTVAVIDSPNPHSNKITKLWFV